MSKTDLLRKYRKGGVPTKKGVGKYKEADTFFIVNDNDVDLEPIKILLPKPPPERDIDGYGLKPEEQKWHPPKYPAKLSKLEEDCNTVEEILKALDSNQLYYKKEIEWIKLQWERRLNGYWLYINGKPTYLDGWNYFYCGFWKLDTGLPEYRDRDRRWFLFARYCYTTTKDHEGNEYSFRTVLGFCYPKHRRDGATYKTLCVGYEIISRNINYDAGIQSFDDDNARIHFQNKLISAWQDLPFFFKPIYDGSTNPKEKLVFKAPAKKMRIGESYITKQKDLGGSFTFATTAKRKFYDGKKLHFIDCEEEGKTLGEIITERWGVIRECLGQGYAAGIHGFAIHPTTVADMKEGGGENYYVLCEGSKYNERIKISGMTKTGLLRLFIPAYDGLEYFVGEFGESIIDNPTPEQAKFIKRNFGAKEFLRESANEFLAAGDSESMRKFRELKELYPTCYADCFLMQYGDIGFNIEKLDAAIARLRRDKDIPEKSTVKGNFKCIIEGEPSPLSAKEFIEKGYLYKKINRRIEFFPDKEGRFNLSEVLKAGESNQKVMMEGIWYPTTPGRYTASADPFMFNKDREVKMSTDKKGMSDGGGSVFKERDMVIDGEEKDIRDWITYGFVCTYCFRPDDEDEYAEEMLWMSLYYCSMMYPEINYRLIWKHFVKSGFEGFMKYDFDEETGEIKKTPGFYSRPETKQRLFNGIRDYIQWHAHRERHLDFLLECKKIKGIDRMTDYDLFTSCGGCLMGSKSIYADMLEDTGTEITLDDFLEEFTYSL